VGVRPRRETRGRREAAAREAANIVTDADVASHVLGFLSVAVGGWCAALWSAGAVCKAWRDGVKALRPALEEWTEFRWEVEKISLLQTQPTTRIYSPPFTSGAGSYEWRLLMCVQRDLPGDEDDENETQHLACYLCLHVPEESDTTSEGRSSSSPLVVRQTQFELQVLSPAARSKQVRACGADAVVIRTWAVKSVLFSSELKTWGHPRFHLLHSLQEKGWVADDDTLRLAVHIRVRNGRSRCPAAPTHVLALADPRRTYARYGGAWHCDVCGKTGKPGDPMHHCTSGCEFDLCQRCCVARERTGSLRSARRSKQPLLAPQPAATDHWEDVS